MEINNLEKFLAKVKAGTMPLGAVVTFSDPAVTELVADAGFDFVWIDGEHGEIDRLTAMTHLMAVRGTDCASFYRVPACNHTEIKRIIDYAPAGVIIPMVMDEKDAQLAVDACRYPLTGNRGTGFRRGTHYGAGDTQTYLEASQNDPLVIIQLEHIEAVRNLDKILSVKGIESFLIGPYDLTSSMGKPGQWHDPKVSAVFDDICRRVKAAGKLLGIYTECDFDLWKKRGVDYMAIKNDTNAMLDGFRALMTKAQQA